MPTDIAKTGRFTGNLKEPPNARKALVWAIVFIGMLPSCLYYGDLLRKVGLSFYEDIQRAGLEALFSADTIPVFVGTAFFAVAWGSATVVLGAAKEEFKKNRPALMRF
jgi:hypothetical protein